MLGAIPAEKGLLAQAGKWRHDFNQQPPFGFRSVVYLAETACCLPLYDPEDL